MSRPAFKTDAPVKTALSAGLLGSANRAAGAAGPAGAGRDKEPSSDEYLDRFQEELHKKVDTEIETLVNGLEDCVQLAKVGTKDKFKAAQDALEIELRAESMVRATENLLSLSHTVKLLFLLHNEDDGSAEVQTSQLALARADLASAQGEVKTRLATLLAGQ